MPKRHPILVSLALAVVLFCIWLWTFAVTARPAADQQEWQPLKELPQPLASSGAVIAGGYLYLVGGKSAGDQPLANVCSARIAKDGTLEQCKALSALPYPLYLHAVVASDRYLYVVGGWDGVNWHKDVWRAAVLDNGNIGAWVKDRDLRDNHKLALHEAVLVQNQYLYILGGQDEARKIQKQVFYAPLQQDGSLGEWKSATDLPNPLFRFSAVANNYTLYVTGGHDGKVSRAEVYYATIDSNTGGLKGGWLPAPNKLSAARHYHKAVIFDQKLLIIGGRSDQQELNSLVAASFDANNAPGVWQALPGLVESLHRFAAVTVDDLNRPAERLYILGGLHGADYRKTVYQLVAPRPELTLAVAPESAAASSDRLVYTIKMTSPYTLSNLVIRNPLPANVHLVGTPQALSDTTFEQGDKGLVWYLKDTSPAAVAVTISYKVVLTEPVTAPGTEITVINSGAEADWTYLGYAGSMKSEPKSALLPYAPRFTLRGQTRKSRDGVTELLLYTIDYHNGAYPINDVSIVNTIPASVTVVADSAVDRCLNPPTTGSKPGEKLQWSIGDLQPWQRGQLFYCVRRLPLSTAETTIQNQGAEIHWRYQGTSGGHASDALSTTFPYAANFTLQNEPRGEISQTGTVTYTIAFTAGLEAVQNVTVANPIPLNTQLVLNSIRSSTGVTLVEQGSSAGQLMRWGVSEIQAGDTITMAYSVSRTTINPSSNAITGAPPPILNEGAMISWSYKDEKEVIFHGEARSNGRRNPPLHQFLPVIGRAVP